ncbi:DUF5793 family protein [Haloarculaceae archaeon H-GB2-1]|nr:DUF5793 family protein [Haloarculaceae archaeon H-GB1-1]MEA5386383.1 DUF5793 family protein [Haloarculaceae archaeon H-GB11]MEA5407891.1 DUF5793 family protein [Haloarculaceae archaeon H-GB2-1]
MRRDYFTLDVGHVAEDDDRKPVVVLEFDGPTGLLDERLTDEEGASLDAGEVDVAFRYTTAEDATDAEGVFSVTNRLTGGFILETNTVAEPIMRFIQAARSDAAEEADGGRYEVVIHMQDGEEIVYDKRTLLVYDDEGDLRREHSLIPSGVEL